MNTINDSGLVLISNRTIDATKAENDPSREVPALAIGIKGRHGNMVGIYKISNTGRIGECVYRHNLITGGVVADGNIDRYPINMADAVSYYIEQLGRLSNLYAAEINMPPAFCAN